MDMNKTVQVIFDREIINGLFDANDLRQAIVEALTQARNQALRDAAGVAKRDSNINAALIDQCTDAGGKMAHRHAAYVAKNIAGCIEDMIDE